MIVIGFVNEKGGSGKSSNSIGFTNRLHYSDKYNLRVAGIDLDPMKRWTNLRVKDLNDIEKEKGDISTLYKLELVDAINLGEKLEEWEEADKYDVVIVDYPGTQTQVGIIESLFLLDYIVVPTGITEDDVDGTFEFLKKFDEVVTPQFEENNLTPPPMVGLAYRVSTNMLCYTQRKEEWEKNGLLDEFGFEFCRKFIGEAKAVYGQYKNTREEVYKLASNKKVRVYQDVYDELAEKLNIA